MGRKNVSELVGHGALAAAAFAFVVYLRQVLTVTAGADVAGVAATAAVLGLAAGAAAVAVLGERAGRKPKAGFGAPAVVFGVAAFVFGAGIGRLALPYGGAGTWLFFAAYVSAGAVPLAFAGYALGLAFRTHADEPDRVYGAFLGGGAAGAVLAAAAFEWFGHAGGLALGAVVAAAAAAALFYAEGSKVRLAAPAALAVAAVALPLALPSLFALAASPGSFLGASGNVLRGVEWSATARAELSSPGAGEVEAAETYGSFEADLVANLPTHEWLTVNGREATPVWRGAAEGDFVSRHVPAFACRLRRPKRALVLGGGGLEGGTVAALCAGKVDLVVDAASAQLLKSSGYAADLDGGAATLHGGNGRAFLRGQAEKYDLIFISPASLPAPAEISPALTPEYLLTVEAFREYYRHLAEGGLLALAAREDGRAGYPHKLAATIYEAFRKEGELKPARGLAVFERGGLVVLFAEPGGFDRLEVEGLAGIAGGLFEPVYLPGRASPRAGREDDFGAVIKAAAAGDFGAYGRDLRPARDDRPFPFRLGGGGLALAPENGGETLGFVAAGAGLVVTAILLLVPVVGFKRQGVRVGGKAGFAVYFLVVGLACATFAASVGPKVAFYLGGGPWSGPTAGAIMLGVAAAGSLLSGKVARRRRWLPFVFVAAATLLYLFGYDALWAATSSWTWLVRFYVAVVLVAVPGFFLGALVPIGLAAAAGRGPAIVPWAWAAYVGGVVCAGIGARLVAAAAGFRVTIIAAFVLVVGAWAAFTWAARSHLAPAPAENEE